MKVFSLVPKIVTDRQHPPPVVETTEGTNMQIVRTQGENRIRVTPASTPRLHRKKKSYPPTPKVKKSRKKIIPPIEDFMKLISYTKEKSLPAQGKTQGNPSLEKLIPLIFKPQHIPYVESILNHYNTTYGNTVRWNDSGELYSPVQNINILRVIRYYLLNDVSDLETKTKIEIMESIAPLNHDYIQHKSLKKRKYSSPNRSVKRVAVTRSALSSESNPPLPGWDV